MSPVLVTGGTGTLGRQVVRRLRAEQREVRVLTRQTRASEDGLVFVSGDLLAGTGIAAAVDGVETIVHCAGGRKDDEVATQNLVHAAASAERPHIVCVSVVGADRVPVRSALDRTLFGYFDMKRKTEQVLERSGLPWTTLRATQFFDLMLKVLAAAAKLPVVPTPTGVAFQPVDTEEVAERMVELALGPPSGLVPDIAGPRVYPAADLIRGYLAATRHRRLLLPIRLPGGAARAVRAGAILAPERAVGTRTWEVFLADHLSQGTPVH
jgi:uncharacterized protein YbjT (DUF2867 family)